METRRIGGSSHTALRSGCESFCHVFDYFLAWSGIFEIFDMFFSCGIWCHGTEKGKMNFFPLSSFLLSNFGGNEKVCNTRNPAYLEFGGCKNVLQILCSTVCWNDGFRRKNFPYYLVGFEQVKMFFNDQRNIR